MNLAGRNYFNNINILKDLCKNILLAVTITLRYFYIYYPISNFPVS